MRIFTCERQYEAMMTCIYDAWSYALSAGHENVRLMPEPVYQPSLFEEYVHIDADEEKVKKVTRSIQSKIGMDAYIHIYYACLSKEDTLDDIYRFLRVGFRMGKPVMQALSVPEVLRMMEIRRNVGNEAHYFREFARFHSIDHQVYVCHLEPKNDVITLVAEHFADRMPSEYFMIIDDNRSYAVIHDLKDTEAYHKLSIRQLEPAELQKLKQTEEYPDAYRGLWKTFFDTIGIEQRRNPKCQRNLMPIRMRKHAVEFMDE